MRGAVVLSFALLFTGCALNPTAGPSSEAGVRMQGTVYGGQQPIVGSHVYLFAAGASGYGQSSISLLNPSAPGTATDSVGTYVTSDTSGGFSITGDYTCTSGTQVYLYALGGNPGAGTNPAAGLLAVLGQCPASGSFAANLPFIQVNEVTTIAAAYAMSGFATDATHVSSSGTPLAQTGIANAFLNADKIASIATGASGTSTAANSSTTVPQAEINSLANILASCVNSIGPTTPPASPNACNALFANTVNSSIAPADTATAAINIAHNPGANVAALYALQVPTAPFAPSLSTQPYDFTIAINYFAVNGTLGNLIAIDASGNVWCSGYNGSTIGVAKLTPSGAPAPGSPFTGNGVLSPLAAAFDPSGNLWVANTNTSGSGTGSFSVFTSTGGIVPGSPFSGNSLSNPVAIAADVSGNIWAANDSGLVSKFTSSGSPAAGSPFSGLGLNSPNGIAIQPVTGNVWITDQGPASNKVARLTSAGVPNPTFPFNVSTLNDPRPIAFDASSHIWIGNTDYTLAELDSTATPIPGTPYSVTNSVDPTHEIPPLALAIDGAGNVWMAGGYLQNYITENTNIGARAVGSPFQGLASPYGPVLTSPNNLAIDGSGNVWVSDGGGLHEFIGAAVPVVTPLVSGVANNTLGTRP